MKSTAPLNRKRSHGCEKNWIKPMQNTIQCDHASPRQWSRRALLLLALPIVLLTSSCGILKLEPVERIVVETKLIPVKPQLTNRPPALNLPAFDNFEVITQGDDGLILLLLRRLKAALPADDPLQTDVEVMIIAFEKQAITLAVRACDTRKRGCNKLPDGTLEFPGPLNHFAQHSDDYLQAGKSWAAIKAYVEASEMKFTEDDRRVNEAANQILAMPGPTAEEK